MTTGRLKFMQSLPGFKVEFSHLRKNMTYDTFLQAKNWIKDGNFIIHCLNSRDKGTVINGVNINELTNIKGE